LKCVESVEGGRRGARAGHRLRARELGQGTVEYVALVALVALIMVGVIAAMKSTQLAEGQQLGTLILKKIAEAVAKVHY
jgi:Flp pilus assembly pilin Flp